VADQQATTPHVLARAGLDPTGFRGWRCLMSHRVPLIEMQVAFGFASGHV
jgi:hypothetical protein